MKLKVYPLVAIMLAAFTTHAQLKVGDNPASINANSVLEIESTNKGLLLPRVALTGTANTAPLAAHVAGMTVYNTATAGTLPNNVTPGYYYNNGTQWIRLDGINIYNSDGTLTGARTVTQGANTLAFTSTAINGFSVDGPTLSVDALNNRIGIGVNNPTNPLVVSNLQGSLAGSVYTPSGNFTGRFINDGSSGGGGGYLSLENYSNNQANGIFGFRARGTFAAPTPLLNGDVISDYSTRSYDGTSILTRLAGMEFYIDGADVTPGSAPTSIRFSTVPISSTTAIERAVIHASGNVGIGTPTPNPSAILDLSTTNRGLLLPRIALVNTTSFAPLAAHVAGMTVYNTATSADVTPGNYYNNGSAWIRIVDATNDISIYSNNGDISPNSAVNRTVSFSNGGSLNFDANTLFVDATNNSVGIGTTTPTAKLDVFGGQINIDGLNGIRVDAAQGSLYVGPFAGLSSTGGQNTFVGGRSGTGNTTGIENTFTGWRSGNANTSGIRNTYIGSYAGRYSTTGNENVYLGYTAGEQTTIGSNNTFMGSSSGRNNTTGTDNVFTGQGAGFNNTTGIKNTFIGTSADATSGNLTNAAAIGYNAKVAASNALVLGGTGADAVNVGIGTTTPNYLTSLGAGTSDTKLAIWDGGAATANFGFGVQPNEFLSNIRTFADKFTFNLLEPSKTTLMTLTGTGNLGVGTTTPGERVEISSGTAGSSGLKFSNLTSSSAITSPTTFLPLAVDQSGNVRAYNPSSNPSSNAVKASAQTFTAGAAASTISDLSLTLPSAGRYLISFSVRAQTNISGVANSYFVTYLYNTTTSTSVPGSETMVFVGGPGIVGATGARSFVIDVTGPTNVEMRGLCVNSNVFVLSDNNGTSTLSYAKL